MCKNHGTRQRFELCHVPRLQGTRQIFGHVIVPDWLLYFAVGREWHTANLLPCARYIAHGKGRLCRYLVAVCGTRQRVCRGFLGLYRVPLAHGKGGVSRSELNCMAPTHTTHTSNTSMHGVFIPTQGTQLILLPIRYRSDRLLLNSTCSGA